MRHGAIIGVAEILIGLSGNSALNKRDILDRAYKQLSTKELELIAESDHRTKFLEMYNNLSKQNYISSKLV